MLRYLLLPSFFIITVLCAAQADTENVDSNLESKHEFSYEDLDTLTKVRLTEELSSSELEDLKSNTRQLIKYDYIYARSFSIKEGQNYTLDNYLLIDASKYNGLRTDETVVEVLDQDSGLTIILDSELEARSKLDESYFEVETVEPSTSRIQN